MNSQNDKIASESECESAPMPAVRARDVIRVLEASGFTLVRSSGSHLQYKKPDHKAVVTVPQHGQKVIKPGTLKAIVRGAGLSMRDFVSLLK